jgi:hypothetical protein
VIGFTPSMKGETKPVENLLGGGRLSSVSLRAVIRSQR